MNSLNFLAAFKSASHNSGNIIKDIDALLSTEDLNVRVIPFGCERKTIEWLDGKIINQRRFSLEWKSDRLSFYRLSYKYKENGSVHENSGFFFILQDETYDDAFSAICIEKSEFFRRALLPAIQSLYPMVLITFITHKRLRTLLQKYQEINDGIEIVITRASQRLRFQEQHHGRRVMPMVSWPSMSLDEAFSWVHEHNGWFESISFDVENNHRHVTSISFSRQGMLKTDSQFEKAYTSFVQPVCKNIHEHIQLFSHRARLERSDLRPRPIVIDFDDDQFAEIAENQRFIQSMRRMRTASVSVLHGNPYVHLSILDYLDGSAFDLWILDQKQLVLVPQLKGTVGSIKRLVNHIFDDYAEGSLADYGEVG